MIETPKEVAANGTSEASEKPVSGSFSQQRKPLEVFKDIEAPWCPEMVMQLAGSFVMGSPESEKGRYESEGPQHEVTISRPFALGRHPVTFAEYDYFCGQTGRTKPGDEGWSRDRRPVIYVSYRDAEAYCRWLSDVTEAIYQLPSEAMWEYACRAGTTTAYAFGHELTEGEANFERHIDKTSQVGVYPANGWGLHDMHGNVWEWCADHWHRSYEGARSDGRAWLLPPSDHRIVRGGSWLSAARGVRAASRSRDAPEARRNTVGFRCARVQVS